MLVTSPLSLTIAQVWHGSFSVQGAELACAVGIKNPNEASSKIKTTVIFFML
jgi:hypothetical protein